MFMIDSVELSRSIFSICWSPLSFLYSLSFFLFLSLVHFSVFILLNFLDFFHILLFFVVFFCFGYLVLFRFYSLLLVAVFLLFDFLASIHSLPLFALSFFFGFIFLFRGSWSHVTRSKLLLKYVFLRTCTKFNEQIGLDFESYRHMILKFIQFFRIFFSLVYTLEF